MESVKEVEGSLTEMKYSPPYVAFGTLRNFLDTLKKDGIPNKINKSVMTNLSGASQSHLTSAFKALRLVEADGEPTSALRDLLDAHGSEEWAGTFKKVLDGAYAEIVGDLDISAASPQELEDRFRDPGGMEASMNDKAVRFYLAALKEAKVELSPYLKKRRQKTTSRRTTRNSRGNGSGDTGTTTTETSKSDVPKGSIDYPVYFKNSRKATIIVPIDLTEQECKMIELTLPLIKAYAQAQVAEETGNSETEEG